MFSTVKLPGLCRGTLVMSNASFSRDTFNKHFVRVCTGPLCSCMRNPPPPTPTQNCLRAEMIQYRLHGSGDGHYNACLETPPELHYVYLPQALLLYCQILQYIVTAVFASTETVFFFPWPISVCIMSRPSSVMTRDSFKVNHLNFPWRFCQFWAAHQLTKKANSGY